MNLRSKIIKILHENKCLNTTEICRLINRIEKCHRSNYAKHTTGAKFITACIKCEIHYSKILSILNQMSIKSVKMRWWDKRPPIDSPPYGNKTIDVFRFWFLDYKDFEQRVLRQTLIPYVQGEKKL